MAILTRVNCNTIKITNDDLISLFYTVSKLQDDKTFLEVVPSTEVLAGASATYTIPSDGVWQADIVGSKASNTLTSTDFTDGETITIDTKVYTLQDTLTNADGNVFITGLAASFGTLTQSGQPSNGQTITVDGKVYTFQTVLTNVDGNVFIGATDDITFINLLGAINLGAGSGTSYAAATILHPTFTAAVDITGKIMVVTNKTLGKVTNGAGLTNTATNYVWTGATSAGGTTNVAETLLNLEAAIDLGTGSGTKYAALTTVHPTVENLSFTTTTLVVPTRRETVPRFWICR